MAKNRDFVEFINSISIKKVMLDKQSVKTSTERQEKQGDKKLGDREKKRKTWSLLAQVGELTGLHFNLLLKFHYIEKKLILQLTRINKITKNEEQQIAINKYRKLIKNCISFALSKLTFTPVKRAMFGRCHLHVCDGSGPLWLSKALSQTENFASCADKFTLKI